MKLFVDMDGVLTDFDKKYSEVAGKPPDDKDPRMWAIITRAGEKFWSEMNWMPEGKELWEALKEYKPVILSSPTRHKSSIKGKEKWLKNNLPDVPFIIEQDKAAYSGKDRILIDDRDKNIEKWEKVGGIGILHKNNKDTLDKLSEIMKKREKNSVQQEPPKKIWIQKGVRGGRPEKEIIPEKGPGSYKRQEEKSWKKHIEASYKGRTSMNFIVKKLDDLANSLEAKGLIIKASQIDVISNTLEYQNKKAEELPKTKDRPAPVFPKESPNVKDDKDHFPIPDLAHGQNALARINQYGGAPSWFDGSLKKLKDTVVKAVKSKFPGMEVEEEKFEPEE